MDELLLVATIGKTVGLKGALKIHIVSDFPEQFKSGAKFILDDDRVLEIAAFNDGNLTAIFKGYEEINLAKELVNRKIYQTIEETKKNCKLEQNQYFYFDIIGLKVFEESLLLGVVDEIADGGANELLLVKTDSALVKSGLKKEFFIPYTKRFVVDVSLEREEIRVKNSLDLLKSL